MLTFEQIKELIEQVADRRLQGLEIERSGFRLKIDGQPAAPSADGSTPAASPPSGTATPPAAGGSATAPPAEPAPAAAPGASPQTPTEEDEGPPEGAHVLKSPIVGTFYRRPSPDADAFVRTGDRVRTGQVLCIVEAMKLMNEIESDVDGTIVEIYPENAQAVEYGEPLFAIQPD